jgi:hypothetical protein
LGKSVILTVYRNTTEKCQKKKCLSDKSKTLYWESLASQSLMLGRVNKGVYIYIYTKGLRAVDPPRPLASRLVCLRVLVLVWFQVQVLAFLLLSVPVCLRARILAWFQRVSQVLDLACVRA